MSTTSPRLNEWRWNSTSSQIHASGPACQFNGTVIAIMLTVGLVALSISVYLAWIGLTLSPVAGCGGGVFDCGHVLASKWSKWMGVPVGVGASLLYAAFTATLGACLLRPSLRDSKLVLLAVTALAFTAGLSALWFVGLQVFAIGHLCPWCLAAHTCSLILAAAVIFLRPLGRTLPRIPATLAAMGVSILIIGQVVATPAPTYEVQHFDTPVAATFRADAQAIQPVVFAPPTDNGEVLAPPVFEPPMEETSADSAADSERVPASSDGSAVTSESGTTSGAEPAQAGIPPLAALIMIIFAFHSGFGSLCVQSADPSNASTVSESPESAEPEVTIGRGTRLRLCDWPLIGSTDAKYAFVEMFDYTCPHCREAHQKVIRQLKAKMGSDIAIIALPVPLNSRCNPAVTSNSVQHAESCELAEISIAVWRLAPTSFAEFHDWLMQNSTSRTAAAARAEAAQLLGEQRLNKELSGTACKAYIKKHVELYRSVGGGAVPKFLFANTALVGKVDSANVIADILRRQQIQQ